MSEATKPADTAKPKTADKPLAEQPAASAPFVPGNTVKALMESRLKLVAASSADLGNAFAAVTPAGTPFENLLKPEFWAHTAYKLRAGDEITVHTDDMSYYGKLYVRAVSAPATQRLPNRAAVATIAFIEFGAIDTDLQSKTHEVVHLGPHLKWCVRSLKDQKLVKENCGTREEAAGWLRSAAA